MLVGKASLDKQVFHSLHELCSDKRVLEAQEIWWTKSIHIIRWPLHYVIGYKLRPWNSTLLHDTNLTF